MAVSVPGRYRWRRASGAVSVKPREAVISGDGLQTLRNGTWLEAKQQRRVLVARNFKKHQVLAPSAGARVLMLRSTSVLSADRVRVSCVLDCDQVDAFVEVWDDAHAVQLATSTLSSASPRVTLTLPTGHARLQVELWVRIEAPHTDGEVRSFRVDEERMTAGELPGS